MFAAYRFNQTDQRHTGCGDVLHRLDAARGVERRVHSLAQAQRVVDAVNSRRLRPFCVGGLQLSGVQNYRVFSGNFGAYLRYIPKQRFKVVELGRAQNYVSRAVFSVRPDVREYLLRSKWRGSRTMPHFSPNEQNLQFIEHGA